MTNRDKLEAVIEFLDENLASIDYLSINVQDQEELFEFAKMVFKSDCYVLLPRTLRYNLVKYITWIML